eukprot:UN02790
MKYEKQKDAKKVKVKVIEINKSEVFAVDPEREIDKGLEKGLTPNQILRHIKGGYKPTDGNIMIVTKLGFIMFHDYFDDKSQTYMDLDHFSFFEAWKNIVNFCIPIAHKLNQQELLKVAMKCFVTAKKDNAKNKRCNTTYSFGLMLESLARMYEMIDIEIIEGYVERYKNNEKELGKLNKMEINVLNQMDTFLAMAP